MPVTIICKGRPSWPREVTIEVQPGWTIADTLREANITSNRHGFMSIVNGRLCRLSTPVQPDDVITIFPRMGGG